MSKMLPIPWDGMPRILPVPAIFYSSGKAMGRKKPFLTRLELRFFGNVLFVRNQKPNYYENITGRNTAKGRIMGSFEPYATLNYYVLEALISLIRYNWSQFWVFLFCLQKNSAAFASDFFDQKQSVLCSYIYGWHQNGNDYLWDMSEWQGNQLSSIGKLIVLMLNAMHMHCTVQENLKFKTQ